jgi:hypothetical protein
VAVASVVAESRITTRIVLRRALRAFDGNINDR